MSIPEAEKSFNESISHWLSNRDKRYVMGAFREAAAEMRREIIKEIAKAVVAGNAQELSNYILKERRAANTRRDDNLFFNKLLGENHENKKG